MGIPNDFNYDTYILLNPDLDKLNKKQAEEHYLTFGIKEGRKYKIHPNWFDIDLDFVRKIYKIDYDDGKLYKYIVLNNYDMLLHPKQLINLFGHSNIEDPVKLLEEYTYDEFINLSVTLLDSKYGRNEYKIMCLVYIGNEDIGNILLDKIVNNVLEESVINVIVIHKSIVNSMMEYIKSINLDNYIIYSCIEYGNDITPSLIVYDIVRDKIKFDYVIKLQTKSNEKVFNESVDFLLKSNLKQLLKKKREYCNCIGKRYNYIKNDIFNKALIKKNKELINKDYFVPGTIFLVEKRIMDNVIVYMKNNYYNILIQNMYDNNLINMNHSYIHFIERLFGIIKKNITI